MQAHLDDLDATSKYVMGCIDSWRWHKILWSYLTVGRFKAWIEVRRRLGSKFLYASYGQFCLKGTRDVLKEKRNLFMLQGTDVYKFKGEPVISINDFMDLLDAVFE